MQSQPSGKSARRLTAPPLLLNWRIFSSCMCLSPQHLGIISLQSVGNPVAPLLPLSRKSCAELRHAAHCSTAEEKGYREENHICRARIDWSECARKSEGGRSRSGLGTDRHG